MSNFMKMRPVGAELFHSDGQTDMTKLIVAFHNVANAPKKWTTMNTVQKNVHVVILALLQEYSMYLYTVYSISRSAKYEKSQGTHLQ
jgi:hypothetical protein